MTCEICQTDIPEPESITLALFTCSNCGQQYEYEEGYQIVLTQEQVELLRKNKTTKETSMQPHQERVVAEKAELDNKRQRLREFIAGDVFRNGGIPEDEQSRLNRQLEAMTLYSDILGERIVAFKGESDATEQTTIS